MNFSIPVSIPSPFNNIFLADESQPSEIQNYVM